RPSRWNSRSRKNRRGSGVAAQAHGGPHKDLPWACVLLGPDLCCENEVTMSVARRSLNMTATRTCRLVTLGCKVNQYETQHVQETLEANGYRAAADGEPADLCIVNTCTVTHEADAKGRQLIRRLAQTNRGAAVVVMGCYASREPETVTRLPGVTHVITDKNRLAEELRRYGVAAMPHGIERF